MLFENNNLSVRLLEEKDKTWLVKWLSDPKVLQYYEGRDRPFDLALVGEKFFSNNQAVNRCIVLYDGKPIGYIQFYLVEGKEREEYGYLSQSEIIYGTDQFIGEVDFWNRGIGKLLVSSIVDFLTKDRKAHKIVMDPQTWNERAIACYEKCGFQKVKLLPLREYHEGTYRDCWLMEYDAK
ncbi:aminoglycoside 6'-N-acetyltransferase [Salirhabdus euzebyi]|uniref:Aminoglycoside 6'-N-acetyltransferase n=1 Tax=Salirhabdus euzebyi TaxID=394506 RepID=A0A841Q4K9_9BACI|nr:GNAT family N-acetyltransferase [Salirhabdus euzebyi]MBB6453351.1 aminoglycoside 6'-N-acetyltransferase [Salirhabdus euzebyi]